MRALENIRRERLGLLLIAAALGVICTIAGLLLHAERTDRQVRARAQGVALARLLSKLPYERLVQSDGGRGVLHVLHEGQGNEDFAYAAVAGLDGGRLVEVAADGLIVPTAEIPAAPAAWLGERLIEMPSGPGIREFYAPVLDGSDRVAQLRVGFYEPGYALLAGRASFLATLALPIFLMAPLAYFLLRRQIETILEATHRLRELGGGAETAVPALPVTGELADFVQAFQRFVSLQEERLRSLQSEQSDLLVSSRVLSWQKTRLETILESLPFATLVLDEAGAVTFANTKVEALLGPSAKEIEGRRPDEWLEDAAAVAFLTRYYGQTPLRARRGGSIELPIGSKCEQILSIIAQPLHSEDEDTPLLGTLVLFRDVTPEALGRKAQGEFVTHVAHELKTPLNVFSMYSEALLGEDGASESFRIEAGNALRDEVERLSNLVNTLLGIARIEMGVVALKRQRVRLPDFLKDALENVSRVRADDLRVQLDVPAQMPAIHVDKDLLRVAINNLLTNAIKYNRQGGSVTLSVEDGPQEVSIAVVDTGIGIDEADLERLFEKFFRSESEGVQARPGHGLGLSITREIVDLHGGQIRVRSTPGQGSEFSIVFKKTPALMGEADV